MSSVDVWGKGVPGRGMRSASANVVGGRTPWVADSRNSEEAVQLGQSELREVAEYESQMIWPGCGVLWS